MRSGSSRLRRLLPSRRSRSGWELVENGAGHHGSLGASLRRTRSHQLWAGLRRKGGGVEEGSRGDRTVRLPAWRSARPATSRSTHLRCRSARCPLIGKIRVRTKDGRADNKKCPRFVRIGTGAEEKKSAARRNFGSARVARDAGGTAGCLDFDSRPDLIANELTGHRERSLADRGAGLVARTGSDAGC
jgi:hypothetical protein